ncbi:MAG: histidine kinase [Bacteroidota bacterium]
MNEDLDSAISLFHRAEEVFKEVKNADGVARCYYNVSVCYESKSDVELIADEMAIMMIDSALLYVEKASEQFFQLGEEDRIANCLKAKGNYYIYRFYRSQLLGDLDSAILFHKQAIHNFSNESCLSLYRIGEAFHWKYTMWEKNGSLNLLEKDSAIYYYVNSIEEGTNQQNKPCLEFGLDGYLTLVEKVKSDDNVLNNTLSGLKKISEDEKLSLQGSEAEFRNFRLALQQKENARKQNLFLTGAGIILAILTALVLIFYQRIRIRHLKLQLRSRLEALRAQVDPHFISNCLNAIELLINENKPKEASEYLIEFSRLCRGILYSTNNESINLAQEIDYLKNYMSLEQLRIGDKLDYEFIVSPGLVPSIITIPTLLIQPFIENAIWHGIQKKEEGGKVSVGFSKIVDKQGEVVLYCTVEDNGIGRQASMNMEEESLIKKEGSYGLTITDERFQILDKIRKAKYEITDLYERNQPKGTLVEIWLPII